MACGSGAGGVRAGLALHCFTRIMSFIVFLSLKGAYLLAILDSVNRTLFKFHAIFHSSYIDNR